MKTLISITVLALAVLVPGCGQKDDARTAAPPAGAAKAPAAVGSDTTGTPMKEPLQTGEAPQGKPIPDGTQTGARATPPPK
jgi:hypothetical protein